MFWFFIAWAMIGIGYIGYAIGLGKREYDGNKARFDARHERAKELASSMTDEMFLYIAEVDSRGGSLDEPSVRAVVDRYRNAIKMLNAYAAVAKRELDDLEAGDDA